MDFKNKSKFGYLGLLVFAVLFFIIAINPSFVVAAGERAIIFNTIFGMQNKIYNPGLNFRIPGLEQVIKYNVKQQSYEVETTAASKDLQNVKVTLRILYNPDASKLTKLYQEFGREKDYQEVLFPSISREVLKAVISKKTAEEVIVQREQVSLEIKESITERMKKSFIQIYDVALAEITFSPEFTNAIEQKQVAQQKFEASKKEAQAAIEKARGEAESARIINDASKASPAFIELRKIEAHKEIELKKFEAQKEVAGTLANSKNVIYLPANTVLMSNPASTNAAQ